jgi:hypothetical protein
MAFILNPQQETKPSNVRIPRDKVIERGLSIDELLSKSLNLVANNLEGDGDVSCCINVI